MNDNQSQNPSKPEFSQEKYETIWGKPTFRTGMILGSIMLPENCLLLTTCWLTPTIPTLDKKEKA
jgi:hypothetical protein